MTEISLIVTLNNQFNSTQSIGRHPGETSKFSTEAEPGDYLPCHPVKNVTFILLYQILAYIYFQKVFFLSFHIP